MKGTMLFHPIHNDTAASNLASPPPIMAAEKRPNPINMDADKNQIVANEMKFEGQNDIDRE